MGPKKRRGELESLSGELIPAPAADVSPHRRVTRSLTRQSPRRSTRHSPGGSALAPPPQPPAARVPPKKRAKKAGKTPEAEEEGEAGGDDEGDVKEAGTMEEGDASGSASKSKTVVIEHCKQCNSFKTRAIQVKKGLEEAVSGITVQVNPEKPRKGCFEIREEGGETFISLLDMKRPFKPMKDLDMEKVISDMIEKIQAEA